MFSVYRGGVIKIFLNGYLIVTWWLIITSSCFIYFVILSKGGVNMEIEEISNQELSIIIGGQWVCFNGKWYWIDTTGYDLSVEDIWDRLIF